MDKKLVLELANHKVYYVKTEYVNYYITIPNQNITTNICIELKSKMANYNLDMNDELWVMENVKNTFSFIDEYNITLVLPILNEECTDVLEKIDNGKFDVIDKLIGITINNAYINLKEAGKEIDSKVILVDNERYKTFINWFISKYKERIDVKTLLELIHIYNVNATAYKKVETPGMTYVVGSYNTEVNAPKVVPEDDEIMASQKLVPQTSRGFGSYWLLVTITIVVSLVVAVIAFMS